MKQRSERAKMYPISLTPDQRQMADARVKKLKPRVSSFSNYVQQLIALDKERNILGSFNFALGQPGELNFAQ